MTTIKYINRNRNRKKIKKIGCKVPSTDQYSLGPGSCSPVQLKQSPLSFYSN